LGSADGAAFLDQIMVSILQSLGIRGSGIIQEQARIVLMNPVAEQGVGCPNL
jgi:hypothetical protein